MFRSPIFYAILAFIISLIVVGVLLPDLACMDGWNSPSIGSSGACSHHGGVNHIPATIGLIVSYAFAFWVWKKAKKHESKLKDPENKVIDQAEKISSGLLLGLNNACCNIWNFIVKLLTRMGLGKLFDKWPIITVIVSFITIVIFPPVMATLFMLGLIAFMNGANSETSYLVPEEK